MPNAIPEGREELLSHALEHLRSALQLLDEAQAPSQLGAHVDLAIHELFLVLADLRAGEGLAQIDRNANPQ